MIEVTIIETGDRAEADDVESALLAARTLGREARAARGVQGFNPTIRFDSDIATWGTTLRALDRG